MKIKPIGKVHVPENAEIKRIEIYPEYTDGLKGIESKEKIDICYWMHELEENMRKKLRVHPQGDRSKQKMGVFALRSPMRPNPIGITSVKLVERRGNELSVEGLDALDGSPVIDIKCGRHQKSR